MVHKHLIVSLALSILFFSKLLVAGMLEDDHFLDNLQVTRYSDHVELVINFTRPMQYSSHAPTQMGRVITVQLVPTLTADREHVRYEEGKNRIVWQSTAELALSEITAQNRGDNAELILHFKQPVSFKIKRDSEHRSLTVQLPISDFPGQVINDVPVLSSDSGAFVINLLSMRQPIDSDLIAKRYALFNRGHLYLSQQIVNNQNYNRLRFGFFTRQQANKLLNEVKQLNPDFSSAWVSRVSENEHKRIIDGRKKPGPETVPPAVKAAAEVVPYSVEKLEQQMERARQAILDKNYRRAIAIYTNISEHPLQPYQSNALELLGMAYERKGQMAHAKKSYQRYLTLYPESEAAKRVKQRLVGLVTASLQEQGKLDGSRRVDDEPNEWDIFGSFSQFYHEDFSESDGTESRTIDSSLNSSLDLNARKQSKNATMRFRFTGSYDKDFLYSDEDERRISSLYLDLSAYKGKHLSRIGRQTRSSGGVLGRFDGIYYGYKFHPQWRLNLVSGGLVDSSSDGFSSDRSFNGLSLDWGPINEHWNFNIFLIDQRLTNGVIDRQAMGGEIRHFTSQQSLFLLADYDIHFEALNIAYLISSWSLTPRTTLNTMLHYRMSPLLTTSNALQGQIAEDIDQLNESYSLSEIKQLAEDRSAISKSASLGLSHTYSPRWQVSSDLTISTMEATQASAGVEAYPSTGNEFFFSSQLIGNSLYKEGDMMIYGLRYSDTSSYEKISFSTNLRYPIQRHWRFSPRLRFDYRENDDDTTQTVWVPSFRTNYRWKKRATFEMELGLEMTEKQLDDETEHSNYLFAYTGYRVDF
ncbi:MAG: hypothetical protein L3J28_10960 [Candidatus Polarisedimenticolaceae bacterium]|nr:hypothetical protein [Candidatus Polarisedimenticolaceae bacterium]